METIFNIFNSQSSIGSSSTLVPSMKVKAISAPAMPKLSEEALIQKQISAPSYLNSLRENEAPPFKKPGKEPKPRLVIGTIMTENDAVAMIAASDSDSVFGLKKYLAVFLIEKKIVANYNISEKNFLISLMMETIDYAAQLNFNAFKLSVLLTIYLDTHIYFKWYYWQSPVNVWNYFKEIMMRHTIEDSPEGQEVFEPEECYDIITHFHAIYLTNMPLIHIVTFGSHRLKLLWPFKLK